MSRYQHDTHAVLQFFLQIGRSRLGFTSGRFVYQIGNRSAGSSVMMMNPAGVIDALRAQTVSSPSGIQSHRNDRGLRDRAAE